MTVRYRNPHWSRTRIIDACAAFYREHQVAPTNDVWWHEMTSFTANTPDGISHVPSKRPYPSYGPIANFWKGMRPLWLDVAKAYPELEIHLDRGDASWSELEEWWVTESVGILPRAEVSRLMSESGCGRTEPAIKRRLYELGINSHNRWGWTIHHLARVINVSCAVIQKYIDHGKLPSFQGNKCVYLEPADFFVVQEYDWSKKRHPRELEDAVRKSLMQRACYIALGFDWRKYAYHRTLVSRVRRARTLSPPPGPKPQHIKVGDWVKMLRAWAKQPGAKGRIGRVVQLHWSPVVRRTQKTPHRPACWVVVVDFPKLKAHGKPDQRRVRYSVPASEVEKVSKPQGEKRELVPVPPRKKRKARMKQVGQRVLATRLNIPSEIQAERIAATLDRGQSLTQHRLAVPATAVAVRVGRRGERAAEVAQL